MKKIILCLALFVLLLQARPRNISYYRSDGYTQELSAKEIYKKCVPATVVVNTDSAGGSGVIINENGYIITNFHVISDAEKIEVKLQNGNVYPVNKVSFVNIKDDYAILKIDAPHSLPYEYIDNSSLGSVDTN